MLIRSTRENLINILIYIERKLIFKMVFLPFLQLCHDGLCYGMVVFYTWILTMKISKLAQ